MAFASVKARSSCRSGERTFQRQVESDIPNWHFKLDGKIVRTPERTVRQRDLDMLPCRPRPGL